MFQIVMIFHIMEHLSFFVPSLGMKYFENLEVKGRTS
jgi:hypothetical protein